MSLLSGGKSTEEQLDLLQALRPEHSTDHAAILTVQPALSINASGGLKLDSVTDNTPVLQLELWNPLMLCGVFDVDQHMRIARADAKAGFIFGKQPGCLLHSSVTSLLGLSSGITQGDLLSGNISGDTVKAKKATLKQGSASQVGVARLVKACHADGAEVKVEMQAVYKPGDRKQQLQLLLRCKDDCTGSIQPLLALLGKAEPKATRDVAHEPTRDGIQAPGAVQGVQEEASACSLVLADGSVDDDVAGGHGSDEDSSLQLNYAPLHSVAEWLDQGGPGGKSHGDAGPKQPDGAHAAAGATLAQITFGPGAHAKRFDQEEPPYAAESVAGESQQGGSVAGESEAGEAESSAAGSVDATQDELSADLRRAKRLKKLMRMLTSRAANSATERLSQTMMMVLPVLVLFHVVCFTILTTHIQSHYENAHAVDALATVADRSQLTTMRAVQLQQCCRPMFENMDTCSAAAVQDYKGLLYTNVQISRLNHQGLYLGFSQLQTFKDPRLLDYWTSHGLDESTLLFTLDNGTSVYRAAQTPLWQQGNKYVSAGEDLLYWAIKMRDSLNTLQSYHYVVENGRNSIFTGYSWSLDVLVDYTWLQLGTLTTELIMLMVAEVAIVQMACILWQFVVLKLASNQSMRRFSVFLALPSATVRILASQSCQVEDDSKHDENEDDDLDVALMDADQGQQQQVDGKASTGKKSVKISVVADDDDAQPGTPAVSRKGNKVTKSDSRRRKDRALRKIQAPPGMLSKLYKQTLGKLFGNIKVNGRKRVTDNLMIWTLMAPLVLWVVAVIIIFGISFQQLSGLQGPLASLNAAAHTLYRTGRVRTYVTLFAFEEDRQKVEELRRGLQTEVDLLHQEYDLLPYGGSVGRVVSRQRCCSVVWPTIDCHNLQRHCHTL
eukprot:GHUV01005618.1.p1 GENE.GHUV01005618.1~~GHUV01005618.1.p1  ORF type:complete len:894 (+),score=279.19 GHUV01005618.1:728-3409(+)